jgi:hypothetical protein
VALHSGSALAAASNKTCATRAMENPQFPPYGPADNYVRVQLWTLRNSSPKDIKDQKVRYFIRGSDVEALTMGSSKMANRFLRIGEAKEFDPQNPSMDFAPIAWPPKINPNELLEQNGGWVAVRFNANAMGVDIIGNVGPSSTGSALAGTCVATFAGIRTV